MPVVDSITLSMMEREFSQKLVGDISIRVLIGPNCPLCPSLIEFGRRIEEASKGKIRVEEERDLDHYPGIRILDNLVYMGLPTGKQTWVLLNFLSDLSRGYYLLDNESRQMVMGIREPVDIDVYINAGSRYSPLQVRWAYEFAAFNKMIRVRVIDGTHFPQLTMRNAIHSTPTTVINNKIRIRGAATPDEFLRKIREALH